MNQFFQTFPMKEILNLRQADVDRIRYAKTTLQKSHTTVSPALDITVGMLNGDASMVRAVDKAVNVYKDMVMNILFSSSMDRMDKKSQIETINRLYENNLSLNYVEKIVGDDSGLNSSVIRNKIENELLKIYENNLVDNNISNNSQLINALTTDYVFTLPILEEVKSFRNGGRINGYQISRGMNWINKSFNAVGRSFYQYPIFKSLTDKILVPMAQSGYSLHTDDIYFLFGVLFDPEIDSKNWSDVSTEDFDFNLNFIDFIFNGQVEKTAKWPMDVTVFSGDSSEGKKIEAFKKKELEFYKKLKRVKMESVLSH